MYYLFVFPTQKQAITKFNISHKKLIIRRSPENCISAYAAI